MTNRTVLITGASGLLGTWLLRVAPATQRVIALTHCTPVDGVLTVSADIRDGQAVHAAVRSAEPTLIMHAAYHRDQRTIVAGTQHVADAAAEVGADLIHVSTDAVFGGIGNPLAEDAVPDPIWDYGKWKTDAEEVVGSTGSSAAIVRLPLIVSADPLDHVVQRINSCVDRGEPSVWFDDEIRQPANAADLVRALWQLTELSTTDRAGAWHLPGPESLNRYQIAARAVARLGLSQDAVVARSTPATARRPRHIDMKDTRARQHIGWAPAAVWT